MGIKNIEFLTPRIKDINKKIVLSKSYSKTLTLLDGSVIDLSSNIGIRENQEDSLAVTENNGYILLLVADGMGGLEKGEEASYTVALIIKKWFESLSIEKLTKINSEYIDAMISTIIEVMKAKILPANGGTTLNMSIIGPEKTYVTNIGDSRTYTIKDKNLELITRDDSAAFCRYKHDTSQERDLLRFYNENNIILNCITKEYLPVVATKEIDNQEYDILCHVTDGVSDILAEQQIRNYSLFELPAQTMVEASVTSEKIYNTSNEPYDKTKFAQYKYSHDNATAIVYTKKRIKE